MRWLDGVTDSMGKSLSKLREFVITDSMGKSLSKLREFVMDREAWRAGIHGVTKSQT